MLAGCAGVKSAFLIKRREAPHFLSVLSSVFGKKSGGIFIKPNLKAAENKGWRIRETIHIRQEEQGNTKSIIIFVTGYEKYMNSAFDVSAFHYLLKPIDEEKFRSVFGRALDELYAVRERTKRFILVRNSGIQQKVYLKDIYYIESANKKVIIHTRAGTLDSYGKMDEWEQMTGSGFYRCHRCYLVNMEQIVSYNADTIKVVNGDKLILAQKKYNDFIRQYMKYAKDGGIVNV